MGTKENRKKSRLKRAPAVKPPDPMQQAPTKNGRDIQRMLMAAGRKPHQYKDWCLHTTGRIIDWVATYNVAGGKEVEGVLLIHKSKLDMFGEAFARQMWSKTLGRRTHQENPNSTTRKNQN
jgi:hypothetical protein